MAKLNKPIAIKVLFELTNILSKHNIKYWLQDGTLLGYYREQDLISYDDDTDIGLFFSDIENKKYALIEILNSGFELHKIKGYIYNSLLLTFRKEGENVDIFFYYSRDNKIYHSSFISKVWQIIDYEYEPFDTKEVSFLGYNFYTPIDEEKFLITKYGNDWMIPKSVWNHTLDPKNAKVTNRFVDFKLAKKEFKEWLKL
jgi:hypothetical protein